MAKLKNIDIIVPTAQICLVPQHVLPVSSCSYSVPLVSYVLLLVGGFSLYLLVRPAELEDSHYFMQTIQGTPWTARRQSHTIGLQSALGQPTTTGRTGIRGSRAGAHCSSLRPGTHKNPLWLGAILFNVTGVGRYGDNVQDGPWCLRGIQRHEKRKKRSLSMAMTVIHSSCNTVHLPRREVYWQGLARRIRRPGSLLIIIPFLLHYRSRNITLDTTWHSPPSY